jgi:DNA-binding phage protein
MTYNVPMITRDQLAELLQGVNVEDVAREAGVSTKTIYRLRHQQTAPTLETVERLLNAIERLRAEKLAA